MFEGSWVCASLAQKLSSLYQGIRYLSLAKMLREAIRNEMGFESASLSGAADHRYYCVGPPEGLTFSFANTTVTFLATYKILRNLLSRFPAWDLNPVSVFRFCHRRKHDDWDPRLVNLFRESLYCREGMANLSVSLLFCERHHNFPLRSA
jgi:hypothetical protein